MRFNSPKLQSTRIVDNNQGSKASYSLEPEQELFKMALTSFVDKSFYKDMDEKLELLRQLCNLSDKDFVIKLAVRARDKGLRTVNQIMLIESLSHPLFSDYFQKLVKRPDEIIDMLGYYVLTNGQNAKNIKLANKLKKAIKSKIESFDDYSFSKYKGKGDIINLYDIVNLVHAKSESADRLMKGTLKSIQTRETELSASGNNKESWTKLLNDKSLGALAFVRNMRSMLKVGIAENDILTYLSNMDCSNVFPYQFIQAVETISSEIDCNGELFKELQRQIGKCFEKYKNLFKGKVAIAVDESGSMNTAINNKSSLRRDRLAMYYGLGLSEMGADLYTWANNMRRVDTETFSLDRWSANGGGTNVNCVIDGLRRQGYDTLFIITDEQSSFLISQSDIPNIIVWNVADYQHSLIPTYDHGYTYITGFNDAQFELIDDLRDIGSLLNKIKSL